MNPANLESLLVKSAKWMFQREKSKDFWWNPGVLTRDNPDKSNPGLSRDEAETVFEELRQRQLLESKIISDPKINEGEPFLVHKINEDKKVEWINTINEKGFVTLVLEPWARHIWGTSSPAVKGFLYTLLLAFCAKLVANCADAIFITPTPVKIVAPLSIQPKQQ